MKTTILHIAAVCMLSGVSTLTSSAQSWSILGNTGTAPGTNFLGTKDRQSLVFRTANVERMRMLATGNVGIGTTNPQARLNIFSSSFVSLTAPGYLMLGNKAQYNMALDVDVIQARYNGTAASLYLNYYGGYTYLGPSGIVAIASDGTLTTARAGISGSSNSSYALNVNANSSLNGINVTDGGNAYAFNATKSGLLAGIYVTKTSTSSADACVWGNSTGSARGLQGNSNTGIGIYASTNNSASYAGYFVGNVYTTGAICLPV